MKLLLADCLSLWRKAAMPANTTSYRTNIFIPIYRIHVRRYPSTFKTQNSLSPAAYLRRSHFFYLSPYYQLTVTVKSIMSYKQHRRMFATSGISTIIIHRILSSHPSIFYQHHSRLTAHSHEYIFIKGDSLPTPVRAPRDTSTTVDFILLSQIIP